MRFGASVVVFSLVFRYPVTVLGSVVLNFVFCGVVLVWFLLVTGVVMTTGLEVVLVEGTFGKRQRRQKEQSHDHQEMI